MQTAETTVARDATRNRHFALYFAVLATAGAGLLVATALQHWGFWGYFGGGLLVFAGAGSLVSQRVVGGAGIATCPACAQTFRVMNIGMRRVVPCPHCHRWLHGARAMTVVPDEHVDKQATFEAPLPDRFDWPTGCPICDAPATRTVKVSGVDAVGYSLASIAPVGVHRVSTVDAPACDAHGDGVGLWRRGAKTFIGFRRVAYWSRFCELNQIDPQATSAAYWAANDSVRTVQRAMAR